MTARGNGVAARKAKEQRAAYEQAMAEKRAREAAVDKPPPKP